MKGQLQGIIRAWKEYLPALCSKVQGYPCSSGEVLELNAKMLNSSAKDRFSASLSCCAPRHPAPTYQSVNVASY